MKIIILLFATIFLFTIQPLVSYSQNGKVTPAFKIVGETKMPTNTGKRTVEYDLGSANHLFIIDFLKNGAIDSKKRFLFSGQKFDLLVGCQRYIDKNELRWDGIHNFFNSDGTIKKSLEYKNDSLLYQYYYYPNWQKKSMIPGDKVLNGQYKIWYPNGQLSFSGNYKNNLKNGDFEQFDESGTSLKKGVYLDGKLISGTSIIPDIVYDSPEVPAKYNIDNESFDDFLKNKSAQIDLLKKMTVIEKVILSISVDKTGKITKLDTLGTTSSLASKILNVLFKPLPQLIPATVENIQVDSQLTLDLLFSNSGIKLTPKPIKKGGKIEETPEFSDGTKLADIAIIQDDTLEEIQKIRNSFKPINQNDTIEEIPEFPRGYKALQKFLASNVQYPEIEMNLGHQGKVFISFVIEEDGSLTSFKVTKSVSFGLDKEAIKVVKSMPNWIPGRNKGKPIRVLCTTNLNFVLIDSGIYKFLPK